MFTAPILKLNRFFGLVPNFTLSRGSALSLRLCDKKQSKWPRGLGQDFLSVFTSQLVNLDFDLFFQPSIIRKVKAGVSVVKEFHILKRLQSNMMCVFQNESFAKEAKNSVLENNKSAVKRLKKVFLVFGHLVSAFSLFSSTRKLIIG